jgi:Arc/MetJ-type ribon-helix-helix transcriptional regulator
MDVRLTLNQEAFIHQAIATGRAGDAVEEALSLWEERERLRAEILAVGRPITPQSMRELANEVQQRGRARFESEERTRR